MNEPSCSQHFSELNMLERDLEFEDIFRDVCPNRFNEFGLKREMRFISERIIVEYDPSDTLSVREIMHPMDPFRTHDPYFCHNLTDKSKKEYVTTIDFHEHITYFPYAKNTGDVCLARYISNFNDINFTKISGQQLCSLPGETIYGLRIGRLDKAMMAVNHRTPKSKNTTVTIIDLVKPARDIVYYDSKIPVNTIDWLWHGPFYLAIGDDVSLRIADVRCPKNFSSVFFDSGVKKTAITSTRPLEIACWDGRNVLLYDIRRPEVPCAIHKIDLEPGEDIIDMKFNPYLTNELYLHTSSFRVMAVEINPTRLIGGRAMTNDMYEKWQVITFKHIDRGCTSTRHAELRRKKMPFENVEIPLHNYAEQYEASKLDSDLTTPFIWQMPSDVDNSVFDRLHTLSEYDFEGYLLKAVERVSAEHDYTPDKPKLIYETPGVETFDFVFPGINGIMCFDREQFSYRIETSPKHYEGCMNPDAGSDSVFYYRGIQIQEMIPAQTLTMMCERLHDGWNAYQTSEGPLIDLAFKITERNQSVWANWLRNSAIIQYGENEFTKVGEDDLRWNELVPLPAQDFPQLEVPPYETKNDTLAATEVCKMLAPFFRMFVPDPIPDPQNENTKRITKYKTAIPKDSYSDDEDVDSQMGLPNNLSINMRTLCKCHAKIRYYNSKQKQRKYMYKGNSKGFFIAAGTRIREKFFRIGWSSATKSEILEHRVKVDKKFQKYNVFNDLKKFNRLKPREFQKRVLPPKLITDSTNILMKPEYIKEREEKEREMREKAAQPLPAPIGMTMTKSRKDQSASRASSMLSVDSAEEDPERARFLIRAALQLADNDEEVPSTNSSTPVTGNTRNTSAASTPIPSAHSTMSNRENDDFEYETAEDAFFGIKKKRMYVVYQPATKPLGLFRYKPDRLGEHTFVRRLEKLIHFGKRALEKRMLKANFKEDDKKLSSIKERSALDLKKALNSFMRLGWQTFYDKNFFFSNKISYNQILRKTFQMYNAMCFQKYNKPPMLISHERAFLGINPKSITHRAAFREAKRLRTDINFCLMNPTITGYNQFLNFLSEEMPFNMNLWPLIPTVKYHPENKELESEFPILKEKPTAMYDRRDDFMFPTGRLRFCEFEIPPEMMQKIRDRRKVVPPRKQKCKYLEDLFQKPNDLVEYHFSRTKSCPDLCLDYFSTKEKEYDDVVFTDGIRQYLANNFKQSQVKKTREELDREAFTEDEIRRSVIFGSPVRLEGFFSKSPSLHNILSNSTKFSEWDSPMIVDVNNESGKLMPRRVVPFPEPEHPRQMRLYDGKFRDIPLEVRQYAANNIAVSWIVNMPIITTYPGIQILDEGRDEMFTLCSHIPRPQDRRYISRVKKPFVMYSNFEEMNRRLNTSRAHLNDYADFVLSQYEIDKKYPAVQIPIFEERSVESIPISMIDVMKPGFYGLFTPEKHSRYQWRELAEMRGRREIQQKIIERRLIVFRQPLHEEAKIEAYKEDVKLEEDDLKTSSDEDKLKKLAKKLSSDQIEKKLANIDEFKGHLDFVRRKVGVSESENLVQNDDEIKETHAPTGSPDKRVKPPKEPRNVSWGKNTEHDITEVDDQNRPVSIMDIELLREVFSMQLRRDRPLADQKHWAPTHRKYSDPLVVQRALRRRLSLDRFSNTEESTSCTDCFDEPWPCKEVCIKCFPDTQIHECTTIENMRIPCDICTAPLYKFSCSNYDRQTDWLNLHSYEIGKKNEQFSEEDLRLEYSSRVTSVEEDVIEAPWVVNNYNSGDHTVEMLLMKSSESNFQAYQAGLLTDFYRREFHYITWQMDDAKAENIFESEQFAEAFDRDADVDMMRDTMNTISQDGDMDMMTTYDQKSGKRVRRWISYSALATRVQKLNEKIARRKRVAEREAKILAGEISVEPEIFKEVKRKAKEKAAALRIEELDLETLAEKERKENKTWKKLEIPKFVEDPKRVLPQLKLPKTEDWLESSGSEDELPPIKARMQSKEIKEFVFTIKRHIAKKPDNFDGLRVVYGKLFEGRPLLKNDVVLVNKKRKMKRKPPQFRIQKIPLEQTWLNNCIKVQILPPPIVAMDPKDSKKWTVPFYSSKKQHLSSRERRKRAFRPPTPPLSLKDDYSFMKKEEREFYHHRARNQFEAMKKAKIVRFMRYRNKLVGLKHIGTTSNVNRNLKKWERKVKAWTNAYQQAMKSRRRHQCVSFIRRPRKYSYKSFVFTFGPRKLYRKGRTTEKAALSSSESEYCQIVIPPTHEKGTMKIKEVTKVLPFVEAKLSAGKQTSVAEIRNRSSDYKHQACSESMSKVLEASFVLKPKPLRRPRGRSVPRQIGSSVRTRIAPTRSFSVDSGRSMKKVFKRLVSKMKVVNKGRLSKIPPYKHRNRVLVATEKTFPFNINQTRTVHQSETSIKPISVLSMQNKATNWEKKMRKLGNSADRRYSHRAIVAANGYRKRPLLPRCFPSSHETDRNDHSSSKYEYLHMRTKRFVKRRTPLSLSPVRSRVLNTARRMEASELRNSEMMYQAPISEKIADIHLNPWDPLKKCNERRVLKEVEKTVKYATMSWKQMLKKLRNYHVKINRVLLKDMRKFKRTWEKPEKGEEETMEIFIMPTPNLKSCMKGAMRRTLKVETSPLERKEPEFGSSNRLANTPTELTPRSDTPSPPKSVKTVPSLLKYNWNEEDQTSRSSTPLSIDTTESISEVVSNPVSPVVQIVEAELKRPDSPLVLSIGGEEIVKPKPAPSPTTLRLLKPVDSPLASTDVPPPMPIEKKSPTAKVTPPKKLPADQQWRAAMMARRNMGNNRQLGRPTIPSVTADVSDVTITSRTSQSPTSPNPEKSGSVNEKDVFDQSVTVSEITARKVGPPKSPGPGDTATKKKSIPPPLSLSEQMLGKRNDSPSTPKSPKPTSPPPQETPSRQRYPGELEPLENIVWPIPEDHVIDLDPDPSDTRKRIHPRTTRRTPPKPGNPKNNGNSDESRKKSFLGRLFSGSKKSPSESNSSTTSTALTAAASSTDAPIPQPKGDELLLPRIKKPESGQLVRRHEKLTMWVPSSQNTAPIAKMVDGKPVYANPTRPKPLARKKPPPPPQPVSSSSSSPSDEEDLSKKSSGMPTSSSPEAFDDNDYPPPVVTSVKTSKAEQKAFEKASKVVIPNTKNLVRKAEREPIPQLKPAVKPIIVDTESPSTSSLSPKPSSGKTVTFGPTYAFGASLTEAYGLLDKPVPAAAVAAITPVPSPKKPIVKKTPVAEEFSIENKEEKKKEQKTEVIASTSVDTTVKLLEEEPEKKKDKKPSAKKEEKAREEPRLLVVPPSDLPVVATSSQVPPKLPKKSFLSGISPFGKITAKKEKRQPQTSTPSNSTSSIQVEGSAGNTSLQSSSSSQANESSRPTRKTSTRRQLRMNDPSPLALSGDASLPKPAEQSPERPPHLDPPTEVQDYKPLSQRKYYTRLGQEWKAPSTTIPPKEEIAKPEKKQRAKKKRRVKKKKPEPVVQNIILDGMERFSQLTEENLKLFDRDHNIRYTKQSPSVVGYCGENTIFHRKDPRVVSKLYGELMKAEVDENEETIETHVEFQSILDNSVSVKLPPASYRPRYETERQKLSRMAKTKNWRMKKTTTEISSYQKSAILALRQVRKVRFLQSHGRKLNLIISSNFKPKSILKKPKPLVSWWYQIDNDGNKRYLKSFGPSERQLKLEAERIDQDDKNVESLRSSSYLCCWAHVMKLTGEEKLKEDVEQEEKKEGKKDPLPPDIFADLSLTAAHPPSRSLSWTSESSTSSLNSLLDDLDDEAARVEELDVNKMVEKEETEQEKPKRDKSTDLQPNQEPVVFFGMTVSRSPSTSTSNAEVSEAVESTAEDGSQIVEYVGQEESASDAALRRFDPFVRPLSALFKAFTSTEIGMEAGARSRTERRSRLGGFFRRQAENFELRPSCSSSPTRSRSTRLPGISLSQNSSAEDILALIGDEPNALEKMEEEDKRRMMFPPLELPDVIPPGKPMFSVPQLLEESLYTQFAKAKRQSHIRKMDRYFKNSKNAGTAAKYSNVHQLIAFNLDEYSRLMGYPTPSLNIGLLGKYCKSSLRVYAKTREASNRASTMIVRKLDGCRERLEKTKKSLKARQEYQNSSEPALTIAAKQVLKNVASRKPKKIRVQYKFKKTCVKYRVAVTIPEKSRKLLRGDYIKDLHEPTPPLCPIPHIVTTYVTGTHEPNMASKKETVTDKETIENYDGDDDDDDEINRESREKSELSSQRKDRQDQKKKLLKHYFRFSVRLARKIARRSLGAQKPLAFYAFINQIKNRMNQFMEFRREKQQQLQNIYNKKSIFARNEVKKHADRNKKQRENQSKPFSIKEILKSGKTIRKQVIVEHTKFSILKRNTCVESFFECLDEYIDVGTPIKLIFRSKNTILPIKAFDSKVVMFDSDIENSPSGGNTDSDFSSDTPEDSHSIEKRQFFNRKGLESTYHVKGLPGLIYLAKLVEAKVGDDLERNLPFFGFGLDRNHLLVYMSPIRRLMLNSLGLRMPDRLDGIKLRRNTNDKFGLWFGRLFRMMCYGRGDACEYIIDMLSTGIGLPRKRYEKMDVSFQARVIYKLYKKMIYLENGKEGKRGIHELIVRGIDLEEENPLAAPFVVGEYDRYLEEVDDAWSREDWISASDNFLAKSAKNPDVFVTCRACVMALRMVFLGGYSQDLIDDLIPLKIPIRDKLLFIINLTPTEHIVENIVKVFNTVRGLDRLPFVGLGYHADPLQVLFDEAKESGDPQLIAHIVRVGRCLDRRSKETMLVDYNSERIKKRDFGQIMVDIFANGEEKMPLGAPTLDEMFPYRYVRHDDGTHVKKTTEQLANVMECEVTRYMAILELTKGAAVTKGDLDNNERFNRRPSRFIWDVLCTGCKLSVAQGRNLGDLGRTLCVSTMPLIEQDKDKKRWPNAKTMSPRLTFENYIETLDPTENKMLMAKDVEEEKTDITVQVLPSRFGCYHCRFTLPRCSVCMCAYLNDHMDMSLKDKNERYSQFSVCNICNHGGHISHIAEWFSTEKFCPVAGCDCRCLRTKRTKNLKGRLRRHMLLSANMRAKSHLCNPDCAVEIDANEGFLLDPEIKYE